MLASTAHYQKLLLALAVVTAWPVITQAADIFWLGGTDSYTNAAAWGGGVVPGSSDNANNNNGTNNVLQINVGNPDWTINDISAGSSTNALGAIQQNGQTVTANGWFHVGAGANSYGVYTMNDGVLNVNNGRLFLGEGPGSTSFLNLNGGVLNKAGDVFVIADGGWNGVGARTGTVTQTGGTNNCSSELWVGQVPLGTGFYYLSGGTINLHNWLAVGRAGATGTIVMTGGTFNKDNNGNFLIGTGDGSLGELDQSGGTINSQNQVQIPEGGLCTGTFNLSGTAALNVNDWLAVGRNGGTGFLNLSGGAITKTGNNGNHFTVGSGGPGTITQTGGVITNTTSDFFLGETSTGTWNFNGGLAALSNVVISVNASASGTLNLNGGVFQANAINGGNVSAISTLNFNGGTLQAIADNPVFIGGLTFAQVGASGAVIDSQNFNITIPQALTDNGGGGLTKNGTGTLTLPAANSYSGMTVVNAGKLVTTTGSTGGGAYTVANNADLSLVVQSANAQLNAATLTLASSTAASVDVDLGNFGNPTLAPLNVSGTMAVNGIIAINLADALPQVGQFPLIKYGTKSGPGSFTIGSFPVGVGANLSNNVANGSIDIVITSVNLPRWDGQAGGNWDIGLTTNWVNIGTGLPTTYGQGNAVQFDDNAAGTTNINLVATVNPSGVSVNNSTLTYVLAGAGKISGATGFTKQGAGTFTIATGANNYTGQTVISGGILNVTALANGGSPSSIGAASASPTNLVLNGGTFSYSGVPTAVNRGYSLIGGLSTITVQSNLTLSGLVTAATGSSSTKTGPARLTYTTAGVNAHSGNSSAGYRVEQGATVFDGSAGGQTNNVAGHLGIGGLGAVNADLTLTNSTLNVLTGGLDLGRSGGATGTLTIATGGVLSKQGGTFALGDGGGQPSFGVVNQTGGFIDSGDELWVGQGVSGVGTYNFSSGTYNQHNWLAIGRRGGYGTFSMTGGTLTKDGNGNIVIGTGGSGSVATLQQSGGTINDSSEYWLAENGGTEATNNISGTAVLNLGNWMSIGRGGHGVINFSGGAINKTGGGNFIIGDGGNGYFNQTGGTLNISSELWIGQSGSGTGRFDLSGGAVTNNSWLAVGREGGNGTLNISGGSMTKNGGGSISIAHGGGPGTINQTGGTFTSTSDTWVGEDSNTGTWNLSNGTVNLAIVHLAQNASATGIVNLDGGTFSASELTTGNAGGTSRLFLNGGTLTATANNTNFLHGLTAANVKAGGAVINSGNNVIGISQSLLDAGGGGGLTKLGNGTLYLYGVNSYTGLTLVSSGALGGTGIIVGPVSVASLATLAPGTALIGTLTVSNTLSLAAGSTTLVKVSLDGGGTNNDLVTGLTTVAYSGSLVVTNIGSNALAAGAVFKLFNATNAGGNFSSVTILPSGTGTFNPATGQLTIGATTPVTIQATVASGGNLILAGAGGTAGGSYAILTSTNVAAPLTTWTTNVTGVFDGSGAFSNAIPITPTESRRFFLIKTP